jgi:hypothetical protein
MCPHCGQNAPVVYRGVAAYCTACGRPRVPLTGEALHLVGQPSRVGSVFARAFGWIVIGAGLSIALGIGAVASFLQWPLVVFAVAAPVAVVSLITGGLLLRGGKHLDRQGAAAEKNAHARAVLALAAQRGGTLTAQDVSAALNVTPEAAEEILQSLAKEQYEKLAVDVDPNGTLVYRLLDPTRLRVDPELAGSPNRAEWEKLEAEEAERTGVAGAHRTRTR